MPSRCSARPPPGCSRGSTARAATACSTSTDRRRRPGRSAPTPRSASRPTTRCATGGTSRRGQRTAPRAAELVRTSWIDVGFRDPDQSAALAQPGRSEVVDRLPRRRRPGRASRSASSARVSLKTDEPAPSTAASTGSTTATASSSSSTTRPAAVPPTDDDARTSLPLALYAAAAWKMFRRRCVRVELHHVPTRHGGGPRAHRRVAQAQDRRGRVHRPRRARADADYAEFGVDSGALPRPGRPAVPVVRLPRALP